MSSDHIISHDISRVFYTIPEFKRDFLMLSHLLIMSFILPSYISYFHDSNKTFKCTYYQSIKICYNITLFAYVLTCRMFIKNIRIIYHTIYIMIKIKHLIFNYNLALLLSHKLTSNENFGQLFRFIHNLVLFNLSSNLDFLDL